MSRYLQSHDDGNRETAEEGDASNDPLRLVSDVPAGAGGGEVEHVAGGACLYGVEGTVALASVRVPDLVSRDTLGPLLCVVTDTPAVTHSVSVTSPPLLLTCRKAGDNTASYCSWRPPACSRTCSSREPPG